MTTDSKKVLEKYKEIEKLVREAKLKSASEEGGSIESASSDAILTAAVQLVLKDSLNGVGVLSDNLRDIQEQLSDMKTSIDRLTGTMATYGK